MSRDVGKDSQYLQHTFITKNTDEKLDNPANVSDDDFFDSNESQEGQREISNPAGESSN